MALFPKYNFKDPSLNYNTVETTVKQMHSYINRKRFQGELKPIAEAVLFKVNPVLTAMRFDSASDLNNIASWKKDVEFSYKMLYPLTD